MKHSSWANLIEIHFWIHAASRKQRGFWNTSSNRHILNNEYLQTNSSSLPLTETLNTVSSWPDGHSSEIYIRHQWKKRKQIKLWSQSEQSEAHIPRIWENPMPSFFKQSKWWKDLTSASVHSHLTLHHIQINLVNINMKVQAQTHSLLMISK